MCIIYGKVCFCVYLQVSQAVIYVMHVIIELVRI